MTDFSKELNQAPFEPAIPMSVTNGSTTYGDEKETVAFNVKINPDLEWKNNKAESKVLKFNGKSARDYCIFRASLDELFKQTEATSSMKFNYTSLLVKGDAVNLWTNAASEVADKTADEAFDEAMHYFALNYCSFQSLVMNKGAL